MTAQRSYGSKSHNCHDRHNVVSAPWPARPCPYNRRHRGLPDLLQKHLVVLGAVLVMSVLSYYVMNRFFLSTVVVQGRSMSPTLQDGDRYLLNRLAYFYGEPRRGDLVVLHDPGHQDLAVKRIVGLPGESVQFNDGQILVNGRCLREKYLPSGTQTACPGATSSTIRLQNDQYFVLGDNRPESEDSRFYGPVARDAIIGALIR